MNIKQKIKEWLLKYLIKHTDLVDISGTIEELRIFNKMNKDSLDLFKSRMADNIIEEIKVDEIEKKRELKGRILEDLHFIINIEKSEDNIIKIENYNKKRLNRREKILKLKQIICRKHTK